MEPADLEKEPFKLTGQRLMTAREKRGFPDPWISLVNRNLYLLDEVRSWHRRVSELELTDRMRGLLNLTEGLSDEQKEMARKMMEEQFGTPKRRKRSTQ